MRKDKLGAAGLVLAGIGALMAIISAIGGLALWVLIPGSVLVIIGTGIYFACNAADHR